jgi:hypothetical protein
VSISPKGFVFSVAAILSIPASIVAVIYFIGVAASLNFAWIHSITPYIQTIAVVAVLMWLGLFVVDYIAIRRTALAKIPAPIDPAPLVAAEKAERVQAVRNEREERINAIDSISKIHCDAVLRIEKSIRDLTPKPEPSLKERTVQLANELFALRSRLGPEPPHALSNRTGTEAEQRSTFSNFFDWHRDVYYNYMAYFRDRVVQVDYELASRRIFTKLNDKEIDPPPTTGEVDLKKIGETLLLAAQQIPEQQRPN